MELHKVKIRPWPVQLNTQHPARTLSKEECTENINLITLPNGDLGVHPSFGVLSLTGTQRIVTGAFFEAKGYPNKLFIFGHKSDGGFVGYLEQGKTTLTTLLSGLPKYRVPRFVKYHDAMYFFGIYHTSYYGTLKYDDEHGVYGSLLPFCGVACLFRGRLFMSDFETFDPATFKGPGYLQFTEVGEETILSTNWYPVGAIDERNTDLVPAQDRILIQKAHETWELVFPTYAVEDAQLRNISKATGTIGHMNSKRHFETMYFYNDRAAHVQNPRVVNVNPERLLEVAPNVLETTLPIKDKFMELFARDLSEQIIYERGDTTAWSLNDFENQINLALTTTGGYITTVYQSGQLVTGWGESWRIPLPKGNYRVSRVVAHGMVDVNYSPSENIKLYVSGDQTTWQVLPIIRIEEHAAYKDIIWDLDVYRYLGDVTKVYFKIWLRNDYRTTIPWPTTLKDISIYVTPYGNDLFGSGFYDERFYVVGADGAGNVSALAFKDGWLDIDNGDTQVFNLIDRILWHTDYNIVGFGRDDNANVGCLIKEFVPVSTTGATVFRGATGELDFDAHDIPKKLRKFFLTYKTTSTWTLKVYGEGGLIQTFNLPAKSDFGIEELNLRTERSKWFKFEIEGDNLDFVLREFEVWVKVFAPDQV